MVASPLSHPEVAASRRNLAEVLAFLERRGASPAMLEMAMIRSGIVPDVARLLSQCVAPCELAPLDAVASAKPVALPAAAPAAAAQREWGDTGLASARALRWLSNTVLVWVGLFGGGLALGFALGVETGVAQGFEEGLDRIGTALQIALQR